MWWVWKLPEDLWGFNPWSSGQFHQHTSVQVSLQITQPGWAAFKHNQWKSLWQESTVMPREQNKLAIYMGSKILQYTSFLQSYLWHLYKYICFSKVGSSDIRIFWSKSKEKKKKIFVMARGKDVNFSKASQPVKMSMNFFTRELRGSSAMSAYTGRAAPVPINWDTALTGGHRPNLSLT